MAGPLLNAAAHHSSKSPMAGSLMEVAWVIFQIGFMGLNLLLLLLLRVPYTVYNGRGWCFYCGYWCFVRW